MDQIDPRTIVDVLVAGLVAGAAFFAKRAVKALDDKLAEIVKKLDKHDVVAAAQGKKLAVHGYRIKQLEHFVHGLRGPAKQPGVRAGK